MFDWKIFFGLEALVVAQWIYAYIDGCLFPWQTGMRVKQIRYALIAHGGMWVDGTILAYTTTHLLSSYRFPWESSLGLIMFAISTIFVLLAGIVYQRGGYVEPEAYTYHGETSVAGWLHGVYAIPTMWTYLMFYFSDVGEVATRGDVWLVAVTLAMLFTFGVVKFSRRWALSKDAESQVTVLLFLLVIVTAWRLHCF